MKSKPTARITVFFLLFTLACHASGAQGAKKKASARNLGDAIVASEVVLALVLDSPGKSTVTPPNGQHALPVHRLQAIGDGAAFTLGPGATVELLCANGGLVGLATSGPLTSDHCNAAKERAPERFAALVPDAGRIKAWHGSLVLEGESRDLRGNYGLRPVLLAPRCPSESSHVLDCERRLEPEPTLRFTAVAGTREYEIVFDGMTKVFPAEEIDCRHDPLLGEAICTLPWPASFELRPGRKSFLQIIAQTGLFERDKKRSEKTKLRLLDDDEATPIRAAAARLQELPIPDGAKALLLASLYAEERLYGEAIDDLETVARTSRDPMIEVALGDTYQHVDLLHPAVRRYERVLMHHDDVPTELRATAQLGLGRAYHRTEELDKARLHLQKAEEIYANLGAAAAAEDVRRLLDLIEKEVAR